MANINKFGNYILIYPKYTLQTNYKSVEKCKREIAQRLEEIDEMAIKLGSEPIVKRERPKTIIESLSDGLYGQ